MAVARGRAFVRTDVLGIGGGPAGSSWDQPRQRGNYPSGPAGQVYGARTVPIGGSYSGGGFGASPGGFGASSEVGMVTDSLQKIQQSYQQAHTLDNGDFSMLSTGGYGGPSIAPMSTTSYQPSFGSNPQLATGFAPNAGARRGRVHVSMTADQMPDPKEVKAQRDRELQEQIMLRRAMQEEQARKAREEEDMLERRARAQQEKMNREYEEEVARKKAKDDARAQRADRLKQRIENQWNPPAPPNNVTANKQTTNKTMVADDQGGKAGGSMNDMDREFLGLKPPAALGLIPPSGAGAGSLLGPSQSSGTNLIAPSPMMGPSSAPSLMPTMDQGTLDMGPEPGAEFLIQKAREMGISIPGDDQQSATTYDPNFSLSSKPYNDQAANPDLAFLRPTAAMGPSMDLSSPAMTPADPGRNEIQFFNIERSADVNGSSALAAETRPKTVKDTIKSNISHEQHRQMMQEVLYAPFHPLDAFMFY